MSQEDNRTTSQPNALSKYASFTIKKPFGQSIVHQQNKKNVGTYKKTNGKSADKSNCSKLGIYAVLKRNFLIVCRLWTIKLLVVANVATG